MNWVHMENWGVTVSIINNKRVVRIFGDPKKSKKYEKVGKLISGGLRVLDEKGGIAISGDTTTYFLGKRSPNCRHDIPKLNLGISRNEAVEIDKIVKGEWRDPTKSETETPIFEGIFEVIKNWDINVVDKNSGYEMGTGRHVIVIMTELSKYGKFLTWKELDEGKSSDGDSKQAPFQEKGNKKIEENL